MSAAMAAPLSAPSRSRVGRTAPAQAGRTMPAKCPRKMAAPNVRNVTPAQDGRATCPHYHVRAKCPRQVPARNGRAKGPRHVRVTCAGIVAGTPAPCPRHHVRRNDFGVSARNGGAMSAKKFAAKRTHHVCEISALNARAVNPVRDAGARCPHNHVRAKRPSEMDGPSPPRKTSASTTGGNWPSSRPTLRLQEWPQTCPRGRPLHVVQKVRSMSVHVRCMSSVS